MTHFGRAGPPDIKDTYSLLVLNITYRTTPDDLLPLFDRYGRVQDIFIPRDRRTGTSRGFAFVRYKHADEAAKAIERLDGRNVDGREIMVKYAKYGRNEEFIEKGRIRDSAPKRRDRSPTPPRNRDRDQYRDRDRDSYREHDRDRGIDRGRDRDFEGDHRRRKDGSPDRRDLSPSRSRSRSRSRNRSRDPSEGSDGGKNRDSHIERAKSPAKDDEGTRQRSPSPIHHKDNSSRSRSASPQKGSKFNRKRDNSEERSLSPEVPTGRDQDDDEPNGHEEPEAVIDTEGRKLDDDDVDKKEWQKDDRPEKTGDRPETETHHEDE